MGFHDRPYMKSEPSRFSAAGGGGFGGAGGGGLGGITMGMPKPSKAVKYLLIINLAVFVIQMFLDRPTPAYPAGTMSSLLGVTVGAFWQIWRYITFQFLHANFMHILLNMLGVYFLGTALETRWGSRRFTIFYLACGVVAGLAYAAIGAIFHLNSTMPIIGASGGVFGILLACAVFFPSFRLIFLFFPVPIRFAALIIFGGMIFKVLQALSQNVAGAAMSDVAHLGGAVAAAVYIWVLPHVQGSSQRVRGKLNQGAWERKMRHEAAAQQEIDQILEKIHEHGLNSLSSKEKKILRDATLKQQRDER